jgi:hypothetical protein
MGFQFPVTRKQGRLETQTQTFFDESADTAEEPGLIYGQKARSLLEWWAARALWKMKRQFLYQYPINGGVHRRGGIVIDFILIDGPPIIIEMQGERWHKGSFGSGERMREAIIRGIFGVFPRYVWENECPTEYDTYLAVRRAIYG